VVTRVENNAPKQLMGELNTKLICFSLNFQLFRMIMQLFDSDWPANILVGAHFQTQENGLMSPDGVCAISAGLAGHETTFQPGAKRNASFYILLHLKHAFRNSYIY